MNLLDRLLQIEARRRAWEVTAPRTHHPNQPTPETMHRLLALRSLELVVAEWTELAVTGMPDLGPGVREILISHQKDEGKHDEQLDLLALYWGAESRPEAYDLVTRWESDPSDPLVKKLVLEAMVFFQVLAVLPEIAPDDAFTQAVRQWILFDESAHVASARLLVKHQQKKIPPALVQLALDTVAWMLGDLDPGQVTRYQSIAQQVIKTGRSDLVNGNSLVSHQDFFTQRDNRSIIYAS